MHHQHMCSPLHFVSVTACDWCALSAEAVDCVEVYDVLRALFTTVDPLLLIWHRCQISSSTT